MERGLLHRQLKPWSWPVHTLQRTHISSSYAPLPSTNGTSAKIRQQTDALIVGSPCPSRATYRGGLAFKRPFDFQEIAEVVEPAVDVNPIHEYARLNLALRRAGEVSGTDAPTLSATGTRALENAFAMIETARRREASAPFNKEVGRLLRVLTTSVENAKDLGAVIREIVNRLHRSVPSLMVRIVDAAHASLIRTDAVYFSIPTEGRELP